MGTQIKSRTFPFGSRCLPQKTFTMEMNLASSEKTQLILNSLYIINTSLLLEPPPCLPLALLPLIPHESHILLLLDEISLAIFSFHMNILTLMTVLPLKLALPPKYLHLDLPLQTQDKHIP